jgi:hypothetical protein
VNRSHIVTPMAGCALRRGLLARFRSLGVVEVLSWAGVASLVVTVVRSDSGGDTWVLGSVATLSVACRLLIATEYVRCDEIGVHYRSLLLTESMPWQEITTMEIGPKTYGWLFPGQGKRFSEPYVIIHCTGACPPRIRSSVWCPMDRQAAFLGWAGRSVAFVTRESSVTKPHDGAFSCS